MKKRETLFKKLLLKVLDQNEGVYQFYRAGAHLFQDHKFPKEDDLKEQYQGLLNFHEINLNQHRNWPLWILEQLDPRSPRYCPPNNQSILNHTHKNWTSLSLAKHKISSQIDETGLCTPIPNEWSVDLWIEDNQQLHIQSQNPHPIQHLSQQLPIIETTWKTDKFSCEHQHFINPNTQLLQHHCTVRNTSESPASIKLYVAIQPFNTEGITSIDSITYLSNNSVVINKKLGLICDQAPNNVVILNKAEANRLQNLQNWEKIYHNDCPQSQCSGYLIYHLDLAPKESKSLSFKLNTSKKNLIPLMQERLTPPQEHQLKHDIKQHQEHPFQKSLDELQAIWAKKQTQKGHWSLTDDSLNRLISNAAIHLESARSPYGVISHTPSKTKDPLQQYLVILALNRLGYFEEARQLCTILKNTKGTDPILTRAYWLLACSDYISLSQDQVFKINYRHNIQSALKKLVHSKVLQTLIKPNLQISLRRSQKKTATLDELNRITLCYMAVESIKDDLGNETAQKLLGASNEFRQLAKHFLESELSILAETAVDEQIDLALIPQVLLWAPKPMLSSADERLEKIIGNLVSRFSHDDIFQSVNNGVGISCSQNLHFLNALIVAENPKWNKTYKQIASFANPCGAWPEYANPQSRGGCRGDGHDRSANALLVLAAYNALIKEDAETITLCPSLPLSWWKESTQEIVIQNLVTEAGKIDFKLSFSKDKVKLSIDANKLKKKIYLKVPFTPKLVKIDGTEKTVTEQLIPLNKNSKELECRFN